jgi:hypothetical protein
MTAPRDPSLPSPARYRRNLALAAPLTLAVPAAFFAGFRRLGVRPDWRAAGLGAGGWAVALALRAPVGLLATKLTGSPQRAQPWLVSSSGPLEEGTRVVALRLAGTGFAQAASLGIGWAAIEVVYSLGMGAAIAALLGRTDEEAVAARELLVAQGSGAMLSEAAPFAGIAERVAASALHIGFTLLVARQSRLALATAPAHSGVNLAALALLRRSTPLAESFIGGVGALALAAGLAAFGRLPGRAR